MTPFSLRLGLSVVGLSIVCLLPCVVLGDEPAPEDFPKPYDSEPETKGWMSAAEAAASFDLPEGFHVSVFAAEPHVMNPIAMTWDTRGRLWVAENFTYAERGTQYDLSLRDRILIFEDTDNDGRFDRRQVFTDQLQPLTGLEVGLGGVWVACPPRILFIPDRDGDAVPDGPPEVVLDGFRIPSENYHTVVNGLRWGPDGRLYGRCGASSPGEIGPPGTSEDQRVPIRGGLWRYHPKRKRFEVLAHGTTNPWGHDWNEWGEPFFINTVNGHLWHAIPGAHFDRPHTIDPNRFVYKLINQHADHYHWDASEEWEYIGGVPDESADAYGGGHAHCGLGFYLADQWPEEYRGKLLTLNLHGRRINVERIERSGSGYVGRHEPDIVQAADPWFRGLDLNIGPDGAVYMIDWSDTGECHEHTGVHRNSGRIYRVSHGAPTAGDDRNLTDLNEEQLVRRHEDANEWHVRQARRVLADRAWNGDPLESAIPALRNLWRQAEDPRLRLRALQTLFTLDALDREDLLEASRDPHEAIRANALRWMVDHLPIDDVFSQRRIPQPLLHMSVRKRLIELAARDESAAVRLAIASSLQRLAFDKRAAVATPLLSRSEDADDPNIPLMIWYGLIPLAWNEPEALADLGARCELPATRRLIARRLAQEIEEHPEWLNELLLAASTSEATEAYAADILEGIADGLRGWRKAPEPPAWSDVTRRWGETDNEALTGRLRSLSVLFGDGRALEDVRRIALDGDRDLDARREALETLIEARPPDLRSICEDLISVRFLNPTALRGLTLFDDPEIGGLIARRYRRFHQSERPAAIDALASRPTFARALLDAIAAGQIPKSDLTAFHARQIRSFDDPELTAKLEETWGLIRESEQARIEHIARLKKHLSRETLAQADLSHGRVLFNRACASCHRLYGHGEEIGPDLTGGGRSDLDYLLQNIITPSAQLDSDYRMVVVALDDGRILNGIIQAETDRTLTLQTQEERLVLERDAIEAIRPSDASLMPDGLLDELSEQETRDLIGYLMHPIQVPLATDTAGDE